ncbi:energy transducer TonB [Hymenobacter glacieicola]|uniref:TonB C-terminal domain-containing protein n=1 Tax=Hymenobacter glacieicola TaxID=1562124 RepID=A0ABQ1WNP3_9BACT|nr:energy transducer TonB [Hymenobacter glacieicola]GGG38105.1 hypothetical protein GCM10011378_13000 [Hymenobacter glacieicola]
MLPLPILNVRLQTCPEDWQQMTPVAQGHHCAQCNRTVLDFTSGTQAELEAAFRASPDGRVCGRFRPEQLAPTPQLRPKLRRFLVALVLVCGLGLTGREAVAQVQKVARTSAAKHPLAQPVATPSATEELPDRAQLIQLKPDTATKQAAQYFIGYVERLPVFKGGQDALLTFLAQNIHWPDEVPQTTSGRVFIEFQVTETGGVHNARVKQRLHPALDAEALRVVQLLDGKFSPATQSNRPVAVGYTIPITFEGSEPIPKPPTRKRK